MEEVHLKKKLIGGEYITFSLKEVVNRLKNLYFSSQDNEVDEDDEHEQIDEDSQDEQDDEDSQDDYYSRDDKGEQDGKDNEDDYDYGPFNSPTFTQRMKQLTQDEDETINVIEILPSSKHHMGDPLCTV